MKIYSDYYEKIEKYRNQLQYLKNNYKE